MNWRIKILSWLLHKANQQTKSEHYYAIKNKILNSYGVNAGCDVQYFEGKKCHSCGGTGVFTNYYSFYRPYKEECYKCFGGWYKLPTWVVLERIKFGKYVFHQPIKRVHSKDSIDVPVSNRIEGYIEHNGTKYGGEALIILYLLYDFKGYWKRWYKSVGRCYYTYWWKPKNFINNVAHIIRKRNKAIPFFRSPKPYNPVKSHEVHHDIDDLPF